jgi:ADP-ribose pyrophosphatase YjhB (NUDIX family)
MADVDSQRAFFASLPRAVLGASVVLRDSSGRVLLVEPTYRDTWLLPGGTVEDGEQPADAARRETQEELGLELAHRVELLVIDWVAPDETIGRPSFCHFVFDGGAMSRAMQDQIRLPADELSNWAMCDREEWTQRMLPRGAARLGSAVAAADDRGGARYCVEGEPDG